MASSSLSQRGQPAPAPAPPPPPSSPTRPTPSAAAPPPRPPAAATLELLDLARWRHALQEPADLVPALKAEGALLCASLCEKMGQAARRGDWAEAPALGKELEAVAWEVLHSNQAWRDVTEAPRRAYAQAQFVLAAGELARADETSNHLHPARAKECLRRLDMALLMGPPSAHGTANALVDLVQPLLPADEVKSPAASAAAAATAGSSRKRPRPREAEPDEDEDTVPRLPCPALHAFLTQHMRPRVPVILTGCMEHWPALRGERAWSDLGYLKRVAGPRTVPVEVGRGTYLSEDGWGQRLMTVGEFIDAFVSGGGKEGEETAAATGYLAQHELFEQIPALRRDILVPDYCALEDNDDNDDDDEQDDGRVVVNAWFGPGGTVSPMHTDPYHNLLAQVVGAKAVRLYSPAQSPCLYPHEGLMRNNSQVDPRAPDLGRFPRFAHAEDQRCVLRAGEMLYIPPLWWHHIEALERSFSVSFWWGRRREMPPPTAAEAEAGDDGAK